MNTLFDPDGLAFLLIFALLGLVVLFVALAIETHVERKGRRQYRMWSVDQARCERVGSVEEFKRRLRARDGL